METTVTTLTVVAALVLAFVWAHAKVSARREKRKQLDGLGLAAVDLVTEPGFSTVENFRYLTESEFKPDTVYEFEHPFGLGIFESMVGQDLDKSGNLSGYFWTLNKDRMCYKASTIKCRLKK